MPFDLRQLRAFETVARHGGFSRASEEAGLTQPTLSTHIRNLENSLGVRLFDRGSRSVQLTPTGVILADYARKILDLCEESLEAVEAFMGRIRGSIEVEASTVPGEYLLPGWLVAFHRRYPEVHVSLTVSDSATVLAKVEKGDIAIGITGSPATNPLLENNLLTTDHIVLVALPEFSPADITEGLEPADLNTFPLIRREPGSGTRLALESALEAQGIDVESINWVVTLGSTRAVIEGVLAGLGGGFLSRDAVTRELSAGVLQEIPLKKIPISRGLYVVHHKKRTLSPVAACFHRELVEAGNVDFREPERS